MKLITKLEPALWLSYFILYFIALQGEAVASYFTAATNPQRTLAVWAYNHNKTCGEEDSLDVPTLTELKKHYTQQAEVIYSKIEVMEIGYCKIESLSTINNKKYKLELESTDSYAWTLISLTEVK